MAELSKLTINLTFNDKGLLEFEDEGTRVAESLNKSYSELDSTFVMLAKDVSEFQQALDNLNSNKLTLNSSFIEVARTIGESYDLSVRFGQSLEDVVEKLRNVKPAIEEANDSLDDTSSRFPDFRPLISLLVEVAKFYRSSESFIKIFITFFDVFKVFASVLLAEFGFKLIALFNTIGDLSKKGFNHISEFLSKVKVTASANYQQLLEFLNRAKEFSKIQFGNFIKFSTELGGRGLQALRPVGDFLSRHSKTIVAFIASSALFKAALVELGFISGGLASITLPELILVTALLGLTYLAVTGQLDDFGRKAEEVIKNHVLPLFQSTNESAEDLTERLDDASTAFENAFPMPTEPPVPTLDPGLKLELAPDNAEELERLEREHEQRKLNNDELERGNQLIEEQSGLYTVHGNALASANGEVSAFTAGQGFMSDAVNGVMASVVSLREKGIDPLSGQTDELADRIEVAGEQVEQAEGAFNTYGLSLGNLQDQNSTFAASQEHVTQTMDAGSVAMDNAGESVEQFGDAIEQVESTGGFFEGMKQGFIDFVKNVESNSELMADFFADTLSQMSQNFSDLFFNVLTGRFDDLKDLAKQAFEAILRAFLDLVSAIATRQIVISIAGAFGVNTKGASAMDALGFGKQAAGIGSDLAGMFGGGGGAALGGSAALGGGISAIGAGASAAGGASSVGASLGLSGISSVGTVPTGGAATFGLSGISSVPAASPGFFAGLAGALPYIGAAIAAAAIIIPLLSGLFKKTPRLDVDFDSVKTELGRRAATISEILDEDFFADNIAQISVKRKAGLGVGGDEGIKKLIQEKLEETIEGIQDIIAKLPTDLFRELNETLLNAEIDIDTVIAGERLLEFDAKGKKIAEKFQQFIEGELPAKLFAGIRESFFDPAFQALGVSAEASQDLIDQFLADMEAAGSREARAQVGQEFIDRFSAFVDAFNIVSGNVNDSIGQTIQTVNNLSAQLGFEAVPSIDALRESLASMIENAEIDPETVQAYADLRNAMVSLTAQVVSSITGIVGKINQLNTTIVSLGGAAVDTSGFLNSAADQIQSFLNDNAANLSLSEQEGFLDQLLGVANDLLAQEQAVFEQAQRAAQEAAERAAEAQRAAIEERIDGLNREKERIEEAFDKRIEALNEELRVAEGFAALTESIRQTLDSIVFSPESVLTGVEQVNALQGNIAALQAELAGTTDPDRQIEIVGRLEEAFKTLFDAAGEAFGVNSPEFVAIFDQVTGGLSGLADMTESRARTVEEINAEIERLTAEQNSQLASIDAKIQSAQDQLSAIGAENVQATFQASDRVKELFEYIRTEYTRILEERMAQLSEISEFGFQSEVEGLGVIAGFMEENLVTLREQGEEAGKQTGYLQRIAEAFESIAEFQHGSGGVRDFGRGTFAVLHGKEAVVTMEELVQMRTGIISQFAEALTGSVGHIDSLAGKMAGGGLVSGLAARMAGEAGLMSGFAGRVAGEGERNEMSVEINVNVNGGSGASAASLGNEIENMLVRSIRQGGRLRSVIQEAGARRMG